MQFHREVKMKERRCSVCSILESTEKPIVKIVEVNGRLYCERHDPRALALTSAVPGQAAVTDPLGNPIPSARATAPVSQASQEQKLTKLTEMAIRLEAGQQEQITLLRSIKGSLTFFVILAIIAIVVQILASCVN